MCEIVPISVLRIRFSFPLKCLPYFPYTLTQNSFPSPPSILLPCFSFYQRAYRWLQTMIFAVEEVNRNPSLLPGLRLGYLASDSCLAEGTTLGAALGMVTGQKDSISGTNCGTTPEVPVIIGDARSSASIVVAQTLGVFTLPMVGREAPSMD